jgi:rod shape-determining protein MreC
MEILVRRKNVIISIVLMAAALLLNLPAPVELRVRQSTHENFAPFQNLMSLAIFRVRESARLLGSATELSEQLRERDEQLEALRLDVQRWQHLAAESEALRAQLDFRDHQPYRMVMCRVIGRGDISGWWQTVRLNRGGRDGILPDMAVVTPQGLVGKTTMVNRYSCDVLLMTDPNCRVSCRVPRTGGFGVVQGRGVGSKGSKDVEMLCAASMAELKYVARDEDIRVGDTVLTSGLGSVYPEGLLIGHIRVAGVEQSGLYQRAEILPAARLDMLRHVFVITGTEGVR